MINNRKQNMTPEERRLQTALRKKLNEHLPDASKLRWSELERELFANSDKPPERSYYKVAAAVALIIAVSGTIWLFSSNDNTPQQSINQLTQEQNDRFNNNEIEENIHPGEPRPERQESTNSDTTLLPDRKETPPKPVKQIGVSKIYGKIAKSYDLPVVNLFDGGEDTPLQQNSIDGTTPVPGKSFIVTASRGKSHFRLSGISVGMSPNMEYNQFHPVVGDIYFIDEIQMLSSMDPRRLSINSQLALELQWGKRWNLYLGGSLNFRHRYLSYRSTNLINESSQRIILDDSKWMFGGLIGLKFLHRRWSESSTYFWIGGEYSFMLSKTGNGGRNPHSTSLIMGYEWRHSFPGLNKVGVAPYIQYGGQGVAANEITIVPYRLGISFTIYPFSY